MILMPIVYVREMDESDGFYERLGFEVDIQARSQMWTELKAADGAVLALHAAEDGYAPVASSCRWSPSNRSKPSPSSHPLRAASPTKRSAARSSSKTRTASRSR